MCAIYSSIVDIFSLVKENSLLQMKLFDGQLQLESNQRYLMDDLVIEHDVLYNRLYVKYHQKMQDHIQKVTNAEQSHELYGKITLLEGQISEAIDESK